ncbi:plastocyanin/azurin family copper-binding protein [Pseudaminobacter sp. NGMCC 1.201702]|uniref:plastocyanin/azurin family copper-binding protein n=1 Tax=Pseudaminobacter sp. NGMCC 1.201702 TaxID=3391825 RepID=UPI0039EE8558
MIITRRRVLETGGSILAGLLVGRSSAAAADVVEIAMQGKEDGSHVWYDPTGIHIQPGQTIRWTNRDAGNSHTVTTYHPANFDRPLRMPKAARPFDSDYLLPGESFSATFTEPGVYDYYCVPHEHAGMVGRIVVGTPAPHGWIETADAKGDLPEIALAAFPSVEEIIKKGIVRPA